MHDSGKLVKFIPKQDLRNSLMSSGRSVSYEVSSPKEMLDGKMPDIKKESFLSSPKFRSSNSSEFKMVHMNNRKLSLEFSGKKNEKINVLLVSFS